MEEKFGLNSQDADLQNSLINLFRTMGVRVWSKTTQFDPKYPYLYWDGEDICQRKNLNDRKSIDSVAEFVTMVEKASADLPTKVQVGEYHAEVSKDYVKVGCQTIPFEQVEAVYNIMKSKR